MEYIKENLGLIAALLPVVAAVVGIVRWLYARWNTNPLMWAREPMNQQLALAQHLDRMGEHRWADEQRENAWTRVLRRLVVYEEIRKSMWPEVVGLIAGGSYFICLGALLLSKVLAVPRVLCYCVAALLFVVSVAGVIVTIVGIQQRAARVTELVDKRYDEHVRAGHVARFERAEVGSSVTMPAVGQRQGWSLLRRPGTASGRARHRPRG